MNGFHEIDRYTVKIQEIQGLFVTIVPNTFPRIYNAVLAVSTISFLYILILAILNSSLQFIIVLVIIIVVFVLSHRKATVYLNEIKFDLVKETILIRNISIFSRWYADINLNFYEIKEVANKRFNKRRDLIYFNTHNQSQVGILTCPRSPFVSGKMKIATAENVTNKIKDIVFPRPPKKATMSKLLI